MADHRDDQKIVFRLRPVTRVAIGFIAEIFAAGVVVSGSLLYSGFVFGFGQSVQAYDAAGRYTLWGLFYLFTVASGIVLFAYIWTELLSAGSRAGGTD